ncbi:MAG: radical SAM protein [Candidatus Lokiarchaeota archaeon]|nr:radical SAM protein [Candidatus Lokiarchaeota archaeon]
MNLAEKKLNLLCHGAKIDISMDLGRKGGAGPAGGSSFILENNPVINLPLWTKENKGSNFILRKIDDNYAIYSKNNEKLMNLKKILEPKFYNLKTSDGILMKQIALLHGKDCLATTVFQRCIYWRSNLQCKFCAIEISLEQGRTTSYKKHEQLLEVIKAGIEEGVITHCTFTTGTLKDREREVQNYINLVKMIRKSYDIPIHVQLEPIKKKLIENLYSSGIDTIGIHIESFDEKILKEICPGKHINHGLEDYKKSWEESVKIFGKNQVSSFILLGLGESQDLNINGSIELLKLGVIPFLVPVRPLLKTEFNKISNMDYNEIFRTHKKIIGDFKRYGIDPNKSKAGCVRCNACSAIKEFFKVL